MVIIVTGGAGFIGSCIVARLNSLGHNDLIIVDHFDGPGDLKRRNIENKRYCQYLDKAEFLDQVKNGRLPGSVRAVIHMGACSSTTGTDPDYYEHNNFQYTRHLADWCIRHGIPFIYASSAATYGDGSQGYADDESSLNSLQPLNLYGWSKHKFDLWVMDQGLREHVVGLKFFNVFGPNEYHKGAMRSVVNKAYPGVASDGVIRLFKSHHPDYADGEQKRDFIYVQDAVNVVMFFMDHPEIHGIYNVGTGQARSWNDLARALFSAVGKPPDIQYVVMPEHLKDRYQYFTQATVEKLRSVGFDHPWASLEDAVRDYVGYLRSESYL